MIKILVVDDCPSKIEAIKEVVLLSVMSDEHTIEIASNVFDAYGYLMTTEFDLLILDINIPIRNGDCPKKNGGISLLHKVKSDPQIKRPKEIIGLTEFEEIKDLNSQIFAQSLWYLIKYDNTSNEWRNQISDKIIYINSATRNQKKITILFLAADPTNISSKRLLIDEEVRDIQNRIRESTCRDLFNFQFRLAARIDDLVLALNEINPEIVHFSGHGSLDGDLIFLDSNGNTNPIKPDGLRKLFKAMKGKIRVLVLNACYSRNQARVISEYIDCCIGMKYSIDDNSAINFAASFYRAIGFGKSIKNAYEQGVASLALNNSDDKCPRLICNKKCNPDETFLIR